jgi:hypothetical protein
VTECRSGAATRCGDILVIQRDWERVATYQVGDIVRTVLMSSVWIDPHGDQNAIADAEKRIEDRIAAERFGHAGDRATGSRSRNLGSSYAVDQAWESA